MSFQPTQVSNAYSENAGLSPIANNTFLLNGAPSSSTLNGPAGPLKVGNFILNTVNGSLYYLSSISTSGGVTSATWTQVSTGAVGGVLPVADGGTGDSSLTNHGVLIGAGTSPVNVTSAGTLGQPLVSGGASADPSYAVLGVVGGGTGAATLTAHGVLLGEGTSAIAATSAGTLGQPLVSGGASADPAYAVLGVVGGGTGVATLTGLALGSGTSALTGVTYTAAGTWTPGIAFGGAATGITYTTNAGYFQQIGNMVFVSCDVKLSSKGSATGAATLTGLPVSTGSHGVVNGTGGIYLDAITLTASYTALCLTFNNSSTSVNLVQVGSGQAPTQVTDAVFANTSGFFFTAVYFTT